MAKKKQPTEEKTETPVTEEEKTQAPETPAPEKDPWEEKYNTVQDSYLRLAADYDNFRKHMIKEKEQAYGNGKADAVEKLLPVYDNLERALAQETQDAAYKKGVEMTMTQLVSIFESLGVEIFGAPGDAFDPGIHNAVMHIDDPQMGENTVAQVFQKGFKLGQKIVRFAMVQVAN